MTKFLQLPPEIRLKIYDFAISFRPNTISIEEGATSKEPPRSLVAKALADVDKQLADDMMPLYWSSNMFEAYQLTGMGHYISTDRTFHRWLREIVKDSVQHVRYLRFKGIRAAASPEIQRHNCVMRVDVDLKRRKVSMFTKAGWECSCDHSSILQSLLENVLNETPIIEGKLRPSRDLLWTLFDTWYMFHPLLRTTNVRSWDEFQRRIGALSGE